MKVRIKTYNGSLVGYLSPDKVYGVVAVQSDDCVSIINDIGTLSIILLTGCFHLNGGSWEIVND